MAMVVVLFVVAIVMILSHIDSKRDNSVVLIDVDMLVSKNVRSNLPVLPPFPLPVR